MMVLISRDLMAISSVGSAAREGGELLKTYASAEQLANDSLAEDVSVVAIDLAGSSSPIDEMVNRIRQSHPQATVIAFGPHVATRELNDAMQAGCDRVMARGQFLGQIRAIVAQNNS